MDNIPLAKTLSLTEYYKLYVLRRLSEINHEDYKALEESCFFMYKDFNTIRLYNSDFKLFSRKTSVPEASLVERTMNVTPAKDQHKALDQLCHQAFNGALVDARKSEEHKRRVRERGELL